MEAHGMHTGTYTCVLGLACGHPCSVLCFLGAIVSHLPAIALHDVISASWCQGGCCSSLLTCLTQGIDLTWFGEQRDEKNSSPDDIINMSPTWSVWDRTTAGLFLIHQGGGRRKASQWHGSFSPSANPSCRPGTLPTWNSNSEGPEMSLEQSLH